MSVFPRKKKSTVFSKKNYVHYISRNSKLNHSLPAMRQMTFFSVFFVQKIGQPLQNKLYIFYIYSSKKIKSDRYGKWGSLLGKRWQKWVVYCYTTEVLYECLSCFYPIAYEKKSCFPVFLSDNLILLCLNILKQQIHIT